MTSLTSKAIASRPLPAGYHLRVTRAPLTLPVGWTSPNAWPEPILVSPPVAQLEVDTYPATLAAIRTADRRSAWASVGCMLAVLAIAVLSLFLRS